MIDRRIDRGTVHCTEVGGMASSVVLEVEGGGALLQYPTSLEIKLLQEPFGPTKPSDSAKVCTRLVVPMGRRMMPSWSAIEITHHDIPTYIAIKRVL